MSASSSPSPGPALHALADGNRRAILAIVRSGPHPVGKIASESDLSQQAATYHLGILRRAGLVTGTRSGTRHLYALNTDGLAAVRSYLDDFWPSKLADLKSAVELKDGAAHG